VPLTAAALALVAIFYKPALGIPKAVADDRLASSDSDKKEIEKRMDKIRKNIDPKKDDKGRSAELDRINSELDRLTRQSHETKDEAREVIKDLSGVEEQIKKREQDLNQRAEALKEQMKQVSRLTRNQNKDGPAKELSRALESGDLEKARNELNNLANQLKAEAEAEKLQKKLNDNNLSKEERAQAEKRLNQLKSKAMSKEDRENLKQQMKDIKEKVQRLGKSKEEKEQALREQADKGELSKDQLQSELERLEKDAGLLSKEDLDSLNSLAKKLDEAGEAMNEGQDGEAGKLLEESGDRLGSLDRENELQELSERLEELEECKDAMCEALDGKPIPASGRRRESKDTVTNSVDKRERAKMSKGKLRVLDTAPGDGIKGPRQPAELMDEIRRASQEAPEAIDRQRLPRSASDMARGYFDKLRGDHEEKPKH
jgi:DNA repair exonuclease SbcCD ATPase subunit